MKIDCFNFTYVNESGQLSHLHAYDCATSKSYFFTIVSLYHLHFYYMHFTFHIIFHYSSYYLTLCEFFTLDH